LRRSSLRSGAAAGLVVAGEVDVELAQQFAGGGVDDVDVVVGDEQQDVGSGVGSADADVAEFPGNGPRSTSLPCRAARRH